MTKRAKKKSKLAGQWCYLSWKQKRILTRYAIEKNWNAYWKYKWICLILCNR